MMLVDPPVPDASVTRLSLPNPAGDLKNPDQPYADLAGDSV